MFLLSLLNEFCFLLCISVFQVGHTHEDIDGRFGKIWAHCRLQTILTPEDYKRKLKSTFSDNKDLEPEFLFAVPNYELFFNDFIDKNLVGYTKKYDTKLQWKFTKTTETGFPLSVKSIYPLSTLNAVSQTALISFS